jgi:hypothetical protein
MGDRSYTTVRAWPWPGENALPPSARDALAANGFAGIDQAIDRQLGDAAIVDGDALSGPILTVVDEEANGGIEGYRDLIEALHEAGIFVYASNGAGGDYDAEWEYSAPGDEPIARALCEAAGETVISARDLLQESKRSAPSATDLATVDDAVLGRAARRLLTDPALPKAVIEAV